MLDKFLHLISYTGTLVSLTSVSIAYTTCRSFGRDADQAIFLVIFAGTMFIYNIDHIRGAASDTLSDPTRVDFITENRKPLIYLSGLSLVVSVITGLLKFNIIQITIITPVLIAGLLHRKLKGQQIPASLYITVSWIVIVVILPLTEDIPGGIIWNIAITGPALFANAYAYTWSRSRINPLIVPCAASFSGLVFAVISPANFLPLSAIPGLTMISVILFHRSKHYKYFYLDGSLLAGALIALLIYQF